MARVIDELLIGISVDADEKEFNEVQSGFDQIKSAALSLGATIAGGLSLDSIIGKTNELAAEWDELAKETMGYEIDPMLLQNLQYMSESLGGAKEDAMGLLLNLRSTQQGLQVGNLGYLEELTKVTGRDVIPLFQTGDEEDILKNLISLFSDMNTQQRQAAFDVMGFTTGTRNLMQAGVEGYEAMVERSEHLGNITKDNTTAAENLQQAYTDAAKASDAAWQDFYGNLMKGSTSTLNAITEGLVSYREMLPELQEAHEKQKIEAGPVTQALMPLGASFISELLFGGSEEAKQKAQETVNNQTTNSSSRSVNYNQVTINANGMSQSQVEGVVYKVINGAATQTEQDLKVNSQ